MDGSEKDVYYVYLLLKSPMAASDPGVFDLGNVLYAGKGKGHRWQDHFKEAIAESEGAKAEAIRSAIGTDPTPEVIEQHALIVAGHLGEAEAFRMEAVMIHLIGGTATASNLVAGHGSHELMVPAAEARVFFGAEDLCVPAWSVGGTGPRQQDLREGSPGGAVVFVVKGTASSLSEPRWRPTEKDGRFERSIVMEESGEGPTERRGWDPHHPWTPDEAATRVRRFWSGSASSVELWQHLIRQRGGYVALVVPDPRDGRSVVRYVWQLEPDGTWEDYGTRFGFPLGEPVPDHPWLGKRLVNESTGRGLLNNPSAPAVTVWDESPGT